MTGDFDNLAAEMTRRERNHAEVRERAASVDAWVAWGEYLSATPGYLDEEARDAFVAAFDLGRDSTPTDWARIAVLQTERDHALREMDRNNVTRTSDNVLANRYCALDKAIKEALT